MRVTNFYELKAILDKYYDYDTDYSGKDFTAFKDQKNNIDIYYKSIHISIKDDGRDKVVRVFLKKQNDDWEFNSDYRKPTNICFEVYTWYYVTVFETDRCENEKFDSGSWNKYLYKKLNEMLNMIDNFKIKNQVATSYK